MNGPMAAASPPPPAHYVNGSGGGPGMVPGPAQLQQQQHHQQQQQPQYMQQAGMQPQHAQFMGMHPQAMMQMQQMMPPQMQQHFAGLPPHLQQQFLQQQAQQQQYIQQQQQQQQQQQRAQMTPQMLAQLSGMIDSQQQGGGGPLPPHLQNNPAFRAAAAQALQNNQEKVVRPDEKTQQAPPQVHPSQMQAFFQAQAQARMQSAAQQQQQLQQSQQQHWPSPTSRPDALPSSQQPSTSQPPQPLGQARMQGSPPPPQQTRSPSQSSQMQGTKPNLPQSMHAPGGAKPIPAGSPPAQQAVPLSFSHQQHLQRQQQQQQQQPFPIMPKAGLQSHQSQLSLSAEAAKAVAGPSTARPAEESPATATNAASAMSQQAQHLRRPSMDQIMLMQRLSQMAQRGGLPIQSLFTKTAWVPCSDEDEPWPEFTQLDKRNIESWMQKDVRSIELAKREKARVRETLEDLVQQIITAQDWLGPRPGADYAGTQGFRVRSRKEMERDLAKRKRKRRPWLEFSKKQLRSIAKEEECLIPIRLDLEHEGRKCSDTFTWNVNDSIIKPATFAEVLCEDLLLPLDPFQSMIVSSISEQVKQYQDTEEVHPKTLFVRSAANAAVEDNREPFMPVASTSALHSTANGDAKAGELNDPIEQEDDEDVEDWWDTWRKRVKLSQTIDVGSEMQGIPWHEGNDAQSDPIQDASQVPLIVHGHDELRILIQLDIAIDNTNLRDQFEWDLAEPQNSPEDFAAQYCIDLGLSGEFRSAIAHLVREQLDAHTRSLSSIRHIRGDQILHDELRGAFYPALMEALRSDDVETWTPHLGKLDLVELEHRERERERQSRRQKRGARNNRRNVVALPEREPMRTSRTLLPRPGAKLEIHENTGPEDPASVPSYEVAEPYSLEPIKSLGPPPRMSSPVRRALVRKGTELVGTAVEGELVPHTGPLKGRPPGGKRRGKQGQGKALDGIEGGTPPPGATSLGPTTASPAPVPAVKKKVVLNPSLIKKPAGWSRIEMTTHENFIDGKWHCTNCGVPEPVAIGRRKGPAGPNTQCAECGKYFMSNKGRLRPCDYTTDPAWHQARQLGGNPGIPPATRGSQAPAPIQVPESPTGSNFEPDSGDDSKPSIANESFEMAKPFKGHGRAGSDPTINQRKASTSTVSAPGQGKGKGLGKGKGAGKGLPPFPKERSASLQSSSSSAQQHLYPHQQAIPTIRLSPNRAAAQIPPTSSSPAVQAQGGVSARPSAPPRKRPDAPKWMVDEVAKLQKERPDDRFEVISKPRPENDQPPEWRLKCLDCPGKVYKTGPDLTLENFSAHLRFKGHRAAVAARLAAQGITA